MNNPHGMKKKIGEMNSSLTDPKHVKIFGQIAFVFFGFLGTIAIWNGKVPVSFAFSCLSFIGACMALFPRPMLPVYKTWLKVTHFIGILFTGLLLSLAFFFVITPTAWIKRVFGGTPLPTKPDPHAETYWIKRSEPVQPKERFIKRY